MRSAINYSNLSPTIIPNKKKIAQWNPQGTYNNNLGSGDIVRFNVQTEELWDPYSAGIEVTIGVDTNPQLADDATFTKKFLEVDGSVSGIFNQMIIYNQSEELERIMQYDTLANILNDINYNNDTRYNRDYEGFGGNWTTTTPNPPNTSVNIPVLNAGAITFTKNWLPYEDLTAYVDSNTRTTAFGSFASVGSANGFFTSRNWPLLNSNLAFTPVFNRQNVTYSAAANNTEWANNYTSADVWTGPSDPVGNGPIQSFTPSFGNNGFEPILSQTLLQRYMNNGFVKTDTITQCTFHIPILSGIFGQLMSPSNYKLIPMKYFKDLVFEFQFNPYFLFSSWWSQGQSARNYTVKNLVLHATLIELRDEAALSQIEAEFQSGIRIPTQSFYLGPLQSIANGAVPPTVQVNLGFESLKSILAVFMPNDYTMNAACRKHYRLSMGITSLQLKIGTDYYPQLAIKGNGGTNMGVANNYEYIKYLFRAFGKLVHTTSSTINPHNFAVNCRAFDPTTTDTYFTGASCVGIYEENRVIGKAVYAIPLDGYNYDFSLLGGVNTTMAKPFEIQMNYSAAAVFTRNVTMITFCHYDMVLYIGPDGIRTLGRT